MKTEEYDVYQYKSKNERFHIFVTGLVEMLMERIIFFNDKIGSKRYEGVDELDDLMHKVEEDAGYKFSKRPVRYVKEKTGGPYVLLDRFIFSDDEIPRDSLEHELRHLIQRQNNPRSVGGSKIFWEGYAELATRKYVSDCPEDPYDVGYEIFKRIEQAFGRKIANKLAMEYVPSERELKKIYRDACEKLYIAPLWGLD